MIRRALLVVALASATATADDRIPGHRIDGPTDMTITVGAVGIAVGAMAIPLRKPRPWNLDAHGDYPFSPLAAQVSDGTLALTLAAPVGYLTGSTIEDADGDRLTIYTETLAVDLALVQMAKYIVQRPRPYTYSKDPDIQRYTKRQGDDAYMSFYSSHAAMAFGAAVSGAYLLSASGASQTVRSVAWASGFATAAMTSMLRVRSGKHFYSDIVVGALMGTLVGYAVPALHATGKPFSPSSSDLDAAIGGLVTGVVASELVPKHHRRLDRVGIVPMVVPNGSGVAVGGRL
jgi:membrane-associated phospholipid phosphatase